MQVKSYAYMLMLSIVCLISTHLQAQSVDYIYDLQGTLTGSPATAPPLVEVANGSNQKGQFVTRSLPANLCNGSPIIGYEFPKDAGLRFMVPSGFTAKSYTIQFTFKLDHLSCGTNNYGNLLSSQFGFDWGLFSLLTDPIGYRGSIAPYPPFGTIVARDRLDTTQFSTITITRTSSGLVKVWLDCSLVWTYQEFLFQAYFPTSPNYFFTFFHDSPAQVAGEANPGLVTNIQVSNYVWPDTMIDRKCQFACNPLLFHELAPADKQPVPESPQPWLYVDPQAHTMMVGGLLEAGELRLLDLSGRVVKARTRLRVDERISIQGLAVGVYIVEVWTGEEVRYLKLKKDF